MLVFGNPQVSLSKFTADERDTLVQELNTFFSKKDNDDALQKLSKFLEHCSSQKLLKNSAITEIKNGLRSSDNIEEFKEKNILSCSLLLNIPPKVECHAPNTLFNQIFFKPDLCLTQRFEFYKQLGKETVLDIFVTAELNNIKVKTPVIGQTLVLLWKLESKPKETFRKFLKLKFINSKNILHSISQFNYEKDKRVLEKKMKDLERVLPPGTKPFTKRKIKRKKKKGKDWEREINEFAYDTSRLNLHMSGSYVHAIIEWIRAIIPRDLIYEALHIYYADQTVMSKKLKIWKTLCKKIHCSQFDFLLDWYQSYIFTTERKNHYHLIQSLLENDCYYLKLYNIPISWFPKNISLEQKRILSEWSLKNNPIGVVLQNYERLITNSPKSETIARRLQKETIDLDFITLFKVLQEQTAIYNSMNISATESICSKLRECFEKNRPNLTNFETLKVALYSDSSFNTVSISSLLASLLVERVETFEFQIEASLINNPDIPTGAASEKALSKFIESKNSHNQPTKSHAAEFVAKLYQKRIKVDSLVLVIDSNESLYARHSFSEWFYKYYHEVHPAHLIIVSFTKADLYMVNRLNSWDLYPHVIYLSPPLSNRNNRAKLIETVDYSKVNGVFGSLLSTKLNLATKPISVIAPNNNNSNKNIIDANGVYFKFNGDKDHDILEVNEFFSFLDWYSPKTNK